ncbi:MAG: LysM peptidoglycan-binding domain-containing protein [Planctomycetota bacterium]
MQQIERYGVIALVFLLVTIVAVSFWGDSKSPSFWSRLTGKSADTKVAQLDAEKPADAPLHVSERALADPLPLSPVVEATPADMLAGGVAPAATSDSMLAPQGGANMPMSTLPSGVGTQASEVAPYTTHVPAPVVDAPIFASGEPRVDAPKKAAANATYTVQKGDSLARIAARTLGDEQRWPEIQALNAGLSPKSLRVGARIVLPADAKTSTAAAKSMKASANTAQPVAKQSDKATPPAKKSGRSYVVKSGDSLRAIARRELGDENRWNEIAALNPSVDPKRLLVGKSLRLPSGSNALVAANVPASTPSSKPRVR